MRITKIQEINDQRFGEILTRLEVIESAVGLAGPPRPMSAGYGSSPEMSRVGGMAVFAEAEPLNAASGLDERYVLQRLDRIEDLLRGRPAAGSNASRDDLNVKMAPETYPAMKDPVALKRGAGRPRKR